MQDLTSLLPSSILFIWHIPQSEPEEAVQLRGNDRQSAIIAAKAYLNGKELTAKTRVYIGNAGNALTHRKETAATLPEKQVRNVNCYVVVDVTCTGLFKKKKCKPIDSANWLVYDLR